GALLDDRGHFGGRLVALELRQDADDEEPVDDDERRDQRGRRGTRTARHGQPGDRQPPGQAGDADDQRGVERIDGAGGNEQRDDRRAGKRKDQAGDAQRPREGSRRPRAVEAVADRDAAERRDRRDDGKDVEVLLAGRERE